MWYVHVKDKDTVIAASLLAGPPPGYYTRPRPPAGLTLDRDFKCNDNICYGIGAANHATFQRLQQLINTIGAGFGAPLALDGFIGPETVSGIQFAATLATAATEASAILQTAATEITGKWVAENAVELVAALEKAVIDLGLPSSVAKAPITSVPTAKRNWWILGSIAALALVGGVSYGIIHWRPGVR